ncbi:MFS transporter [Clostridia bacterium]|nr:MFS transporter [Clostridia bacterium]
MSRIVILILLYLLYFGIGAPNSILGAAWPEMYSDIGADASWAGILTFAMSIGMIAASFFGERYLLRRGTHLSAIDSFLVIGIAILGYAVSQTFVLTLGFSLLLGLGIGLAEAMLNGLLVRNYSARDMNWVHCLWSIGASAMPLIIGHFIAKEHSWSKGFAVPGIYEFVLVVLLIMTAVHWRRANDQGMDVTLARRAKHRDASQKDSPQKKTLPKAKGLTEILRVPGSKVMILSMFCYCSLEMMVILWSTSYLVFFKGIDSGTAAAWLSLVFVGMTLGRLMVGFLSIKFSNRANIRFGIIFLVVGVVALLFSKNDAGIAIGLFILGVGMAPFFPCLMHSTGEHFPKDFIQAMVGIEMTAAFVGNAVLPLIFGGLASAAGYGIFPFVLTGIVAALFISTELIGRHKMD